MQSEDRDARRSCCSVFADILCAFANNKYTGLQSFHVASATFARRSVCDSPEMCYRVNHFFELLRKNPNIAKFAKYMLSSLSKTLSW